MSIDFSIFKNVDFTNRDNLIFLVLIFIIAVVALVIIIIAVLKIFKLFRKIISKMLGKQDKKQKLNQKEVSQKQVTQEVKAVDIAPKQMVMGGDYLNINNKIAEEGKKIEENKNISHELPHSQESKGVDSMLKQKVIPGSGFKIGEKNIGEKIDSKESYKEKEVKNITEHLGKLKAVSEEKKDTLLSKMPSRSLSPDDSVGFDKIKIATKKVLPNNDVRPDGLVGGTKPKNIIDYSSNKDSFPLKKPDIMENKIGVDSARKSLTERAQGGAAGAGQSTPMFGKGEEVSRKELRYKLLKDPKIWKAQKDLRMNLSPVQRVKLEKENFSSIYGRDISKRDLKINLKRMGKEWANTPDIKRKEFLRKEIKFFKKIGGIK